MRSALIKTPTRKAAMPPPPPFRGRGLAGRRSRRSGRLVSRLRSPRDRCRRSRDDDHRCPPGLMMSWCRAMFFSFHRAPRRRGPEKAVARATCGKSGDAQRRSTMILQWRWRLTSSSSSSSSSSIARPFLWRLASIARNSLARLAHWPRSPPTVAAGGEAQRGGPIAIPPSARSAAYIGQAYSPVIEKSREGRQALLQVVDPRRQHQRCYPSTACRARARRHCYGDLFPSKTIPMPSRDRRPCLVAMKGCVRNSASLLLQRVCSEIPLSVE